MLKTIVVLISVLSLTACGGEDENTAATVSDKNLFSSWADTGSSFILDLSAATFGTTAIGFFFAGGEICACNLTIAGTQSSGNYALTSCTYSTGSGGGVDPGCSSANGSGTYTKTATTLTMCDPSCIVFQ